MTRTYQRTVWLLGRVNTFSGEIDAFVRGSEYVVDAAHATLFPTETHASRARDAKWSEGEDKERVIKAVAKLEVEL